MLAINKCILFFALAVSASALTTPHDIRHAHHRSVAAHIQVDATPQEPVIVSKGTGVGNTLRRRTNSRCTIKQLSPKPVGAEASPSSTTTSSSSSTTTYTTTSYHPDASKAATPAAPKSSSPSSSSGGSEGTITVGSNLSSFMVGTQTGQGTFYATGLGACGITNNDSQYIAAVSYLLFDTFPDYNGVNPNENPICGRQVTASYQGKSVTVTLTDRCTGCKITDLDFSPSAFDALADPAVGRISGMTWDWI